MSLWLMCSPLLSFQCDCVPARVTLPLLGIFSRDMPHVASYSLLHSYLLLCYTRLSSLFSCSVLVISAQFLQTVW
jgi:hypothetical protein